MALSGIMDIGRKYAEHVLFLGSIIIRIEAFARRDYGRILCLDNQLDKGQEALEKASELFTKLGMTQEVAATEKLLACLKLDKKARI